MLIFTSAKVTITLNQRKNILLTKVKIITDSGQILGLFKNTVSKKNTKYTASRIKGKKQMVRKHQLSEE